MDFPSYWPDSGWILGWKNGDGSIVRDTSFMTAPLPLDAEMGLAIQEFVQKNLAAKEVKMSIKSGTYKGIMAGQKDRLKERGDKVGVSEIKNFNKSTKVIESKPATIKDIRVVSNPTLWNQYCRARQEMHEIVRDDYLPFKGVVWVEPKLVSKVNGETWNLPVLDETIGEMMLFHGTREDIMAKIAANGFSPDVSKFKDPKHVAGRTDWGMLGMGTYFADALGKSMTYFFCETHNRYECGCTRVVMLARVVVGRSEIVKERSKWYSRRKNFIRSDKFDEVRGKKIGQTDKDKKVVQVESVIGTKDIFAGLKGRSRQGFDANEVLIKDKRLMYPEFVIYYGIE